MASRTEGREIPSCSASTRSPGRRPPRVSRPAASSASTCARTSWWVRTAGTADSVSGRGQTTTATLWPDHRVVSARATVLRDALRGPPTTDGPDQRRSAHAHRALHHLSRGRALPRRGQGDGAAAGTARARGRLPRGPDVLRADAHQHRLPARGAAARAPLRGDLRAVRGDRRALGLVCRVGAPPARDGRPRTGRRGAGAAGRGGRRAHLRAVRAAGRRAGRRGRGRLLPAPRHLPPHVPLAAACCGWARSPCGCCATSAG